VIDLDAILTPIEGENPAGENLRYTPTYDSIAEARKEGDPLEAAELGTDVKMADWDQVVSLAVAALETQTKDLQIGVWLMEALTRIQGYPGLNRGMQVIAGLMDTFWEDLYPEIEDDDLDYRIGPLEFMNEKLWLTVKQVPLTDPSVSRGFSWMDWQDSRQVGSDAEDLDEEKREAREEMIAAGKPTVEEFDLAVTKTSKMFYETLAEQLDECLETFSDLDKILDERFGMEAPRTAEFKGALEDCQQFIGKTLKQKRELEPDPETEDEVPEDGEASEEGGTDVEETGDSPAKATAATVTGAPGMIVVGMISDIEPHEAAMWDNAVKALRKDGVKKGLDVLFSASCSVSSVREKNRYRLMMAKLCLQAGRHDLAHPIAEELNTMVEELGLERWESPVWVGDVLGAYYRCLVQSEDSEDNYKADEIFKKMCTIDLTKALQHKQSQ